MLEVWILELDAVVDADGLISSCLLRSVLEDRALSNWCSVF